jgi:hypothetical protein
MDMKISYEFLEISQRVTVYAGPYDYDLIAKMTGEWLEKGEGPVERVEKAAQENGLTLLGVWIEVDGGGTEHITVIDEDEFQGPRFEVIAKLNSRITHDHCAGRQEALDLKAAYTSLGCDVAIIDRLTKKAITQ